MLRPDEEGDYYGKDEVVRARINPELKRNVEVLLSKLGLTTTQAITLFFQQMELRNGLPFPVELPRGDLKDVNDLDVLYDETRHFLPVQIYPHSGANCSGGDYYANVRVKEWDPATPDDKVAQWRGVDMRTGSVYLADSSLPEDDPRRCNHSSGYSECDAKVRVGSFVQ